MSKEKPIWIDAEASTIQHINWRCDFGSIFYTVNRTDQQLRTKFEEERIKTEKKKETNL